MTAKGRQKVVRVAVPVATLEGMTSERAQHFGAAIGLVFADVCAHGVRNVASLERPAPGSPHCDDLVDMVLEEGADVIIVTEIGRHALDGLCAAGVKVVRSLVRPAGQVSLAIRDLVREQVRAVRMEETCEAARGEMCRQ